jgi:hypothetical protein
MILGDHVYQATDHRYLGRVEKIVEVPWRGKTVYEIDIRNEDGSKFSCSDSLFAQGALKVIPQ